MTTHFDLTKFLVSPDCSIREVITLIDTNTQGITLIVDEDKHLIGTVTDGDIRRTILSQIDLDLPVKVLLENRSSTPYPQPIVASSTTSETELIHLMNERGIRHIPILNLAKQVVDIAFLSDLMKEYELPLEAVVMAGGFGTRLRPLTENIPKPMLPVGDKPLLEIIINRLKKTGIRRVNLTTHYLGEVISQHFGNGKEFGVDIQYVEEKQPLGTAGALRLLEKPNEPLLVMNGDILTNLDFRAMLDFHHEQQAAMTVAVRANEIRIPYGVIELDGVEISNIKEKPIMRYFVNAGIYLLNPEIQELIPNNQNYDMPTLIERLIAEKRRVVSFPIHEYWLDIGQHPDYQKALTDVTQGAV